MYDHAVKLLYSVLREHCALIIGNIYEQLVQEPENEAFKYLAGEVALISFDA